VNVLQDSDCRLFVGAAAARHMIVAWDGAECCV